MRNPKDQDEPAEMRTCAINVCNSLTQLLLICVRVCKVLRNIVLGIQRERRSTGVVVHISRDKTIQNCKSLRNTNHPINISFLGLFAHSDITYLSYLSFGGLNMNISFALKSAVFVRPYLLSSCRAT